MIRNREFVRVFSLLLIILILISPTDDFALCESDIESARSMLESAEGALASAYLSIVEAERSGGDISPLVMAFNGALNDLSAGRRALDAGDYELASDLASEAVDLSDMVTEEAVLLRHIAEYEGEIEFRNRLILAFMSVYLIVLLGFLGWRLFRVNYLLRMGLMKPEVAVDEP
jgi:hypothetical protein